MKDINTDLNPNEVIAENTALVEVKQEGEVIEGEVITNFENIGVELCQTMLNVEIQADSTRREAVEKAIFKCSKNKSHKKDFLDGWAKEYQKITKCDAGVRDSRKSEIRKIYEAITQADTESLQIIQASSGWHNYVNACRKFLADNVSAEIKQERENKRLENLAIKAEKLEAEKQAKEREPLTDDQIQEIVNTCKRLTLDQLKSLLNGLTAMEAEKLEAEKLEAEKLEAEKLEAEKLEAEKLEAEFLALQARREALKKSAKKSA
jgi:hypothetical protein